VPNPPNLHWVECNSKDAVVVWEPRGDNRAPILTYKIQYNTSFIPDTWETATGNEGSRSTLSLSGPRHGLLSSSASNSLEMFFFCIFKVLMCFSEIPFRHTILFAYLASLCNLVRLFISSISINVEWKS
jgi:hypothetical protein